MSTTDVAGEYRLIEIGKLHESSLNPRKLFAEGPLQELAASIRESNIITPLIVRPNAKGFEIAAGHRRYRAAKLAGLELLPTIVREMDDKTFVEILNIENLQRQDMTPLEEAEGYRLLMTKASYKVERIAERVGRSVQYIYDRLKLLELTPEAAKLLREDRITAGHAILIARLKPADQQSAIHVDKGGLFEREQVLDDADARGWKDRIKPRSVRELDGWIAQHVRFDTAATDAMVFPATAATLTAAKETEEKVIKITHNFHVQESARDEKERTWSPQSWKRADGQHKSKTCEHAVIGVLVAGPGRGEAFKVCTQKEKCKTHWGEWQRDRDKRAKFRAQGGTAGAADRREQAREARELRDREAREAEQRRLERARPKILEAVAAAVKKAPTRAAGLLGEIVIAKCKPYGGHEKADLVARGTTADDLVRHAAFLAIVGEAYQFQGGPALIRRAKAFGIDVKKIVDQVAPAPKAEAKKEEPKPKKKAKKK